MHILAIESSCDETAAAVVQDGSTVLSNVIASSEKSFENLGGVVPEEAARKQVEYINAVINEALTQAKLNWSDIDALAVTRGPGLLGSLLVGATAARTIASIQKKPLIGVHHTLGHLCSPWLDAETEPVFPILTLSASGGHTDLWYRTSPLKGALLGRTRDDAAGEAFDKGASLLGLSYPGGPAISKEAEGGNPDSYDFPLPLRDDPTLNFSFSGLKTSLKYTLRDNPNAVRKDLSASYEHALCRHLVDRITRALKQYPDTAELHLVGGVSANKRLRQMVQDTCKGVTIRHPLTLSYCTDNAAMIASAAFYLTEELGERAYETFETMASVPLEKVIR